MLTVTQRPEASLYENNPPDYLEDPYYISRWSSAHLPLVYKISNTKFPVNSDDSIDAFSEVVDAYGYARFNLVGSSYEEYIVGEKVSVSGSTSYDGIFEVKDVVAGEYITLDILYQGSETGTIQRYYDNYAVLVKLYAGIPEYHPYYNQDPMAEIGVYAIAPNSSNLSVIDVRDLVRQKISQDNDINGTGRPNDLNAWTGFYVKFAETYDTYETGLPETYTSGYTTDYIEGCADVVLTNPNFDSNLNGWLQNGEGSTDGWIWDGGTAKALLGGSGYSFLRTTNLLYQTGLSFKKGVAYTVTIQGDYSEGSYDKLSKGLQVYVGTNSDRDKYLIYSIANPELDPTNIDATFTFTLPENCTTFGFSFQFGDTYPTAFVRISSVSFAATGAESSDCLAYIFAHNGTRQFFDLAKNERSQYGGNMAGYVQNYNTQQILAKFLTRFDTPTYFNGKYFDLGTIIPQSTLDIPYTEDGLILRIKQYLNEVLQSTTDHEIVNNGDGVYRLRLDNKLSSGNDEATVQIVRQQTNTEWFGLFITGDEYAYIGNLNEYDALLLESGSQTLGMDTFGFEGGIVTSTKAGVTSIYSIVEGAKTLRYTSSLANYDVVKAFDANNWIVASRSTAGYVVICINGTISEESVGIPSYFYGIDGDDINNLYAYSQVTLSNRKILQRVGGSWGEWYDFGLVGSMPSGKKNFQKVGNYLFAPATDSGTMKVFVLGINGGETVYSVASVNTASISMLSETDGVLASVSNLYRFNGTAWTLDTDFATVRTGLGDTSNIQSVSYQGDDLIMVASLDRIYIYSNGWTDGVGGDYPLGDAFLQVGGSFSQEEVELLVSEEKTIAISSKCSNQDVYISWMNSLGNWEYFLFTARKQYEKFVENTSSVRRNIYANWDTNFSTETEDDKISIEAYDKVTVRSQYVSRQELDILSEIIHSIRVQAWYSATDKITVMVDTDTIKKYSDGDKLYAIEFDIIYPMVQVQKQ